MQLVRFSDDLLMNNLCVVSLMALAAVCALIGSLVATAFIARRAAQTLNTSNLEEAVRTPLRGLALVCAQVSILLAGGLLGLSQHLGWDLLSVVNETLALFTLRHVKEIANAAVGLGAGGVLGWVVKRGLSRMRDSLESGLLRVEAFREEPEIVKRLGRHLPAAGFWLSVFGVYSVVEASLALSVDFARLVSNLVFVVMVVAIAKALTDVVQLTTELLDSAVRQSVREGRGRAYYEGVRHLWPLVRRSVNALAAVEAAALILGRIELTRPLAPYGERGLRLIVLFIAARLVVELSRVAVEESMYGDLRTATETRKRRTTAVYLIQSFSKYVIYIGACLLALYELGIDPTPILAGAGILGLTIGLGAQKLVNDMVSGFFLLFEGSLLTGDYVRIGEAEGIIEGVQLRMTRLRDNSGRLHLIRNGNIETIINYSREFVMAIVDVGVAYESNMNEVYAATLEAGRRLRLQFPGQVLEDMTILGVEELGDSSVVLRTATRVTPASHLLVGRAFRRLLKETYGERGIEIPYPRQVNYHVDRRQDVPRLPVGETD